MKDNCLTFGMSCLWVCKTIFHARIPKWLYSLYNIKSALKFKEIQEEKSITTSLHVHKKLEKQWNLGMSNVNTIKMV